MPIKVTIDRRRQSSSFVPPLIRSLISPSRSATSQVTLMDVNEQRVRVMEALAGKLIASEGSALQVTSTLDQRESLRDADFVIVAISVGGMDAWANDIEIPGRYGIVMHVADSIGPGGIMRAFRNAPVLADVARDVAEVAPDALGVQLHQPGADRGDGDADRARRSSRYALCSCTAHPASPAWLAEQASASRPTRSRCRRVVAGINHCASRGRAAAEGRRDALPLVARARDEADRASGCSRPTACCRTAGTHWVEFHPQMQYLDEPYEGRAQGLRHALRDQDPRHGLRAGAAWQQLEELAAHVDRARRRRRSRSPTCRQGDEDEGIEVIDMMEAIVEQPQRDPHRQRASTTARSRTCRPTRSSRSTPQINAYGIRPIYAGRCPSRWRRTCATTSRFQKQMVQAALSGDRKEALHAFLLDPTIAANLDLDQTAALLDEMLARTPTTCRCSARCPHSPTRRDTGRSRGAARRRCTTRRTSRCGSS